ncbi:TraR/DksA family transcriptional regulator [Lentisphaerota bacterium WC36G]|nr:TraR/DksA family transcriptional regulator [Lentisphaerae bacterium WC36]
MTTTMNLDSANSSNSNLDGNVFYEMLIHSRQIVQGQYELHKDDALNANRENSERAGMATHMADIGSENNRQELELQLLSEEGDILRLIDEAIERLEDDCYGECLDCGDQIGEARLMVKPYAMYCVKCKGIREANDGENPFV